MKPSVLETCRMFPPFYRRKKFTPGAKLGLTPGRRSMQYADKLRRLAPGHNPRHVAAWMILGNATPPAGEHALGKLMATRTTPQFEREVELAIDALKRKSPEFSARLAEDY